MGICPYCGEHPEDEAALEPGDTVLCFCGHEWRYDPPEDPADLYAEREEEERERWIPDRGDEPRKPN